MRLLIFTSLLGAIQCSSVLHDFIRFRCGNILSSEDDDDDFGIWSYEGVLSDPFNGSTIAKVEGVELVREIWYRDKSVADDDDDKIDDPSSISSSNGNTYLDLETHKMLQGNSSKSRWDEACTVLQRRLFCYTDLEQTGVLSRIESVGVGRGRQLTANESVAYYDTATTYIKGTKSDNNNKANPPMFVTTEFPDGRILIGKAKNGVQSRINNHHDNVSSNNGNGFMDYIVYTKPRPDESKEVILPKSDEESLSIKPKRTHIVQFGRDDRSLEKTRYGARERYEFRLPIFVKSKIKDRLRAKKKVTASPSVRYTRYGECPPFYGPGKMCTLEITGTRVSKVSESPSIISSIASRIPDFFSIISLKDDDHRSNLLLNFKDDLPSQLNLMTVIDDERAAKLGGDDQLQCIKNKAISILQKLSSSSNIYSR